MLVSIEHGFVLLFTPKCASTSLERALHGRMDLVARGPLKHENYRRYERFYRPLLAQHCEEPLETVCVIREPVDWLASWYRYRTRDSLVVPAAPVVQPPAARGWLGKLLDWLRNPRDRGLHEAAVPPQPSPHVNSTSGVGFDEFVEGYLSPERPAWAEIGSQYNFIRNQHGEVGVDRIFPYERIDLLVEYLSRKMGMELSVGTYNKSPEREISLRPDLRERLVEYFEKDYAVYAKALADCGG